jgi:hypothetical protein
MTPKRVRMSFSMMRAALTGSKESHAHALDKALIIDLDFRGQTVLSLRSPKRKGAEKTQPRSSAPCGIGGRGTSDDATLFTPRLSVSETIHTFCIFYRHVL